MEQPGDIARWEPFIDEYSALHGVFGMYLGFLLSISKLSQGEKITVLIGTAILFEIFEYLYFKKINHEYDTRPHACVDILIGVFGGWMMIQQK